jgi:uncharacterized protein (TIGR02569 family)
MVFYGTKAPPPTLSVAKAFGSTQEPVLLKGGQNTTYRSGDIILKPSEGDEKEQWIAAVFSALPKTTEVRIARPVTSSSGSWVHGGYVAWTFLSGEHVQGVRFAEKIRASRELHTLLKDVPKPATLGTPASSWATADQVVWHGHPYAYDKEFMQLIDQITPHLKELEAKNQICHGDLSGNFLLDDGLPPAIIDFSPVWAASGFAEGVMLADAIVWEKAEPSALEAFKKVPNIAQFAWRGIFRRIAEQAEHITWFGKQKPEAVHEARAFQKAIDYLKNAYAD